MSHFSSDAEIERIGRGLIDRSLPKAEWTHAGHFAAAEAGLGIAQIPAFVLKDAMERGTLELVLGDWFPDPSPLYVVYPQNRHLSNKVRVFVDWVAELLREHDGIQLRSSL